MKVIHKSFPLIRQSNRAALLNGLLTGTTTKRQVVAAIKRDAEPRPHTKPVSMNGLRYDSVTDAAKAMVGARASFNKIEAARKRIAKWCEEDCWEGYYWCE